MVFERVRNILERLVGAELAWLTTRSSLPQDLSVTPREIHDIVWAVEGEFNVKIYGVDELSTVEDLCAAVSRAIAA